MIKTKVYYQFTFDVCLLVFDGQCKRSVRMIDQTILADLLQCLSKTNKHTSKVNWLQTFVMIVLRNQASKLNEINLLIYHFIELLRVFHMMKLIILLCELDSLLRLSYDRSSCNRKCNGTDILCCLPFEISLVALLSHRVLIEISWRSPMVTSRDYMSFKIL